MSHPGNLDHSFSFKMPLPLPIPIQKHKLHFSGPAADEHAGNKKQELKEICLGANSATLKRSYMDDAHYLLNAKRRAVNSSAVERVPLTPLEVSAIPRIPYARPVHLNHDTRALGSTGNTFRCKCCRKPQEFDTAEKLK